MSWSNSRRRAPGWDLFPLAAAAATGAGRAHRIGFIGITPLRWREKLMCGLASRHPLAIVPLYILLSFFLAPWTQFVNEKVKVTQVRCRENERKWRKCMSRSIVYLLPCMRASSRMIYPHDGHRDVWQSLACFYIFSCLSFLLFPSPPEREKKERQGEEKEKSRTNTDARVLPLSLFISFSAINQISVSWCSKLAIKQAKWTAFHSMNRK